MSPYENRLNQEAFRRIALVADIKAGSEKTLTDVIADKPMAFNDELIQVGIRHLHLYQRDIGVRKILFIYFESDHLNQETAVQNLKQSSPWWARIETCLGAHPRATAENAPWQRAEFINVIADNTGRERETGQPLGLIAGLHTDSELWYRTLHQTNWPGVIDQMARSHYQNWTTFMIEWGDTLYLLTHVEYLGSDKAADDVLMAADPVTQRWWTHTQPCLYSLIEGEGVWVSMEER